MLKKIRTAVVLVCGCLSIASASTLKFVASAATTSVDPQFHNVTSNFTALSLIYEELVYIDKNSPTGRLSPRLAESWQQLPGDKVEIHLRKGVTFHDGSDFTANDVIYTLCRMSRVKNSPGSLAYKIDDWQDVTVVDDHKIIVQKPNAAPQFMAWASGFHIISDSVIGGKKIAFNGGNCDGFEYTETADFDSGKLAIGTGPYTFESYVKGQSLTVRKNTDYWGSGMGNMPAHFDAIKITSIKNKGSRVAALLAGDVDVIEAPSVHDLDRLRNDDSIKVIVNEPTRSIYVMYNVDDSHAKIKGTNGKNPFQDVRVRRALSLAIDRKLLVNRVMGETGIAATNVAPSSFFGIEPNLNAYAYNPDKARALLADAGYPNGFEITFGAPNDRYMNDAKVSQVITQMWSRIGIKVNLESVTKSIFFSNRTKKQYPVWMAGWGKSDFDAMTFVMITTSKNKRAHVKGYLNPTIEALYDKILATADDIQREQYIKQAIAEINKDMPYYAVLYERFPLALRNTIDYEPPAGGENTFLRYFKPAK